MSEAARLFVGVRLSMVTVRALEAMLPALRQRAHEAALPVSWVAPENFHVTVKFLGWARPETIHAVKDRVGAAVAEVPRFDFEAHGAGAFPDEGRASVLWAGVAGAGAGPLTDLYERVEAATTELGFAADSRPYHAHITLGRLRDPEPVADLLAPIRSTPFERCHVEEVILYESLQGPSGVHYEERAVLPLIR